MHMKKEIDLMWDPIKVVLTLGKVAFDTYCSMTDTNRLKFNRRDIYLNHPVRLLGSLIILVEEILIPDSWSMWIKVFNTSSSISDNT